jgi:hypothetical protein
MSKEFSCKKIDVVNKSNVKGSSCVNGKGINDVSLKRLEKEKIENKIKKKEKELEQKKFVAKEKRIKKKEKKIREEAKVKEIQIQEEKKVQLKQIKEQKVKTELQKEDCGIITERTPSSAVCPSGTKAYRRRFSNKCRKIKLIKSNDPLEEAKNYPMTFCSTKKNLATHKIKKGKVIKIKSKP